MHRSAEGLAQHVRHGPRPGDRARRPACRHPGGELLPLAPARIPLYLAAGLLAWPRSPQVSVLLALPRYLDMPAVAAGAAGACRHVLLPGAQSHPGRRLDAPCMRIARLTLLSQMSYRPALRAGQAPCRRGAGRCHQRAARAARPGGKEPGTSSRFRCPGRAGPLPAVARARSGRPLPGQHRVRRHQQSFPVTCTSQGTGVDGRPSRSCLTCEHKKSQAGNAMTRPDFMSFVVAESLGRALWSGTAPSRILLIGFLGTG
jgi:hypothetical protein